MTLAALLFDPSAVAGAGAGSGAGPGPGDDDAPLVHHGGRTVTRGEVRRRATELAGALDGAGIEPGHAVGVMLPNGADVVAALFGVWRAGGVYVPLNPRLTDGELSHILASVSVAAIVTTPDQASRFAGRTVVAADEAWTVQPASVSATASSDADRSEPARFDGDIALISFTSGTTGRPKPVLLRHSGVLTLVDGVLRKLRGKPPGDAAGRPTGAPAKPPMPNLIPVSMSLWAGIYTVVFALRAGAPVVVMDRFDPATFAELVRTFAIRSTVLPPAAMTMLADDESVDDLAPLRFVRSISSPLSPFQARRFKDRFGIAVLNSYGQTEIGGEIVGWSAADSRQFGETKLGSVGRPHEGVEVRVVDSTDADADADADVDDGEPGELWVRTPALSAGYADGADLGDRLSPDGFFRTGDVGRVDADGFVWIEGRVSDMINRGGLKVHPADVEEVVRLSPAVADVAVVGVPDDRLGEVPWAFVVLRPGEQLDAADLEARCRAELAPYKVPARFVAVDALPRNEVGKVLSRQLAEQATRG